MGYTIHQIYSCYDRVVESYCRMGFRQLYNFDSTDYSINTYMSTRLVLDSSNKVKISLTSKRDSAFLSGYPIQILTISADRYDYDHKLVTEIYNQFYYINDNYYTTDLLELKHARNVSLERYLKYHSHSTKTYCLNLNKISSSLMSYIKKAVNKRLNEASESYSIRDIYFSYNINTFDRYLFVVIDQEGYLAARALRFKPQLLHMYKH